MIVMQLQGPIVPYVRMTKRGMGRSDAQRYLASQDRLRTQMRLEMARQGVDLIRRGVPLLVSIRLGWVNHRQDVDNLAKAVLDAANGTIWEDDRWVDVMSIARDRNDDGITLMVDGVE